MGWILLFVSGVVGLWRLEGIPAIYHAMGLQNQAEGIVHRLRVDKERGKTTVTVTDEDRDYPIDQSIENWRSEAQKARGIVTDLNRPSNIKYKVQRYALVLGLLMLMLSRGYGPFSALLCAIGPG